jgi:hypothetical protein
VVHDCPAWVSLWSEYARATVWHVGLAQHIRIGAFSNHERANLSAAAERAGRRRTAARQAILDHENIVHGNSYGNENQGIVQGRPLTESDKRMQWQHLADELMGAYVSFQRAKTAYDRARGSSDLNRDGYLTECNKRLAQYCRALDRLCQFTLRANTKILLTVNCTGRTDARPDGHRAAPSR